MINRRAYLQSAAGVGAIMLAGCLSSKDKGPEVNELGYVVPTLSYDHERVDGYTRVTVTVEKMGEAVKVIVTPPQKHPTYTGDGEPYDYAGWKWEFNEPGEVTLGQLGPHGSVTIAMLNPQGDVTRVDKYKW